MHPEVQYQLVKFKINEDHRIADRERLVRAARADKPQSIDAVGFRQRVGRIVHGFPQLRARRDVVEA